MHSVAQPTENGQGVGPRRPGGDHRRKRRLPRRNILEPAASLPSGLIGAVRPQAEHVMSNTGYGAQCAHEEDQAYIEGGQGVFRNVVVLLAVHRPQQVVAGLENTRNALEDGTAEIGQVMRIRSLAPTLGVCDTGGVPRLCRSADGRTA